jgi:hypothetical protein
MRDVLSRGGAAVVVVAAFVAAASTTTAAAAAAAFAPSPAASINAQLYPCNASDPWGPRQQWTRILAANSSSRSSGDSTAAFSLQLDARGVHGALVLQQPAPTTALTCAGSSTCLNVIVGFPSTAATSDALLFERNDGGQLLVVGTRSTPSAELVTAMSAAAARSSVSPFSSSSTTTTTNAYGLCLAADWAGSHGYLPNVFVADCTHDAAAKVNWTFGDNGTVILRRSRRVRGGSTGCRRGTTARRSDLAVPGRRVGRFCLRGT